LILLTALTRLLLPALAWLLTRLLLSAAALLSALAALVALILLTWLLVVGVHNCSFVPPPSDN
jgi:hypothetical protein